MSLLDSPSTLLGVARRIKSGFVGSLIIFYFLFLVFGFLCGCAVDNDISGEDYGNIAESGIILTESGHPIGWGKADCFECHSTANIHQTDRTGTGLNLEAIQEMTERDGLQSCPPCHGDNGVE